MIHTTAAPLAAPVSATSSGDEAGFAAAFEPTKAHVADMREMMTDHLLQWRVPEPLAGDIVLALSELATNAVVHGHGTVRLTVRRTSDQLRVAVTDGNPAPAQVRSVPTDAESGRGLFLVAAVADAWGVSEDGKTTWCTFCIPAGSS